MRIFQYISILVFFLSIIFIIYQNSPKYQIIKGEIYGTYYNIKINTPKKNKNIADDIKSKLQQIDSQMSVFNDESDISKINNAPANKNILLSTELAEVLKASHIVWKQSNGWFDPTIGQLINLWGFGNSKTKIPTTSEIKKVLKYSGFDKLKFINDYKQILKTNKNTQINLSAIAKGYAVDKIAELLDDKGYLNYIIDIGGEVKAKGYRSDNNEAWNVAISKPQQGSNENITVLSLSNMAVATSGNYRNYYQKNGKTYAHTISPKNGYPTENKILSVTVFHNSCMYADAYATAINAMGLDKGIEFASKNNIKAIIYDNNMQAIYTKNARTIME